MPAEEKYWKQHWQERSKVKDEAAASGWGNRDPREYLYDIDDIAKKLDLKSQDKLLNVGCGNGLMELVLNYWVRSVDSVDFSEGMIERAKMNNKDNPNVEFFTGNILDLGFLKGGYDKVLCNSVIQYLSSLNEVIRAFQEISKVAKASTRVLISANPDKSKVEEFLSGYDKLDLSEEEKKKKKDINSLSLWTDPNEVERLASGMGFKTQVLKMNPNIWQSWYMYDLLIWR